MFSRVKMNSFWLVVVTILVLSYSNDCNGMTDKATGIAFPATKNGLDCFGCGVRKIGPIKIYSVAMYSNSAFKSALGGISRSIDNGKKAFGLLRSGSKENSTSFLLEMNMKVGAEKISSSIADAIAPRHSGSSSELESLKGLIFDGVESKGGTATKGTTFQFDCSSKGVAVAVDGKMQGNVSSTGLASAFCDLYLDDKCVSPAMRQNCIENCCAP